MLNEVSKFLTMLIESLFDSVKAWFDYLTKEFA